MIVHTPFEEDIANPTSPVHNQTDAIVGARKLDQISQIRRSLGKGSLADAQYVLYALLVPNLIETPNKGTVFVLVMTQ